ncbi:hypothetical protein ACA30_04410 [Virgibacillus soli]|uniref:Uncharacterized protein n=1 Tax=Lederbergia galactosidilytica TaxID=217031 RepID=A0A177ZHY1_9BACI|nr:hypothetical protein ACA30_04410 [Virgibacillus soli]OAK67571.1 hypothetical protein ABB05_20840 [Lederbergia galactosidilytica]
MVCIGNKHISSFSHPLNTLFKMKESFLQGFTDFGKANVRLSAMLYFIEYNKAKKFPPIWGKSERSLPK